MNNIHEDLFCTQCSLKFGNSLVYGLHLKLVHARKNKSQLSKHKTERKKSMPIVIISDFNKTIASFRGKENSFKCEICDLSCSHKDILKKSHVTSFHDRKKPFKCRICKYTFTQMFSLKKHVATVHDGRKLFKCNICDYSSSQNSLLKTHVASVHDVKKPF